MTQPTRGIGIPARLNLVAWSDPAVETQGHQPGSAYVEAVWLSVLGPSATWAWQRLARIAANAPASTLDVVELARSLGVGESLSRTGPVHRILGRLAAFGVARWAGDTVAVRLALPDLPAQRLGGLPASVRSAHEHLAYGPTGE